MKIEPRRPIKTPLRAGFTLLEVIIALGIAGTMLTTIFLMADSTIRSTSSLVETQNAEITQDAFLRMLDRHFKELPGDCRMELTSSQSGPGGRYLSTMTFQNAPVSFSWGGRTLAAEALTIETRPTPEGDLDIVLAYYEDRILDTDGEEADRDPEPIAEIALLKNVHLFEWRLFDSRDWVWEWERPTQRPVQVELIVQFDGYGEQVRRVFWWPKKVNPTQFMRRFINQARQNPGGGGGGGGGTPPGDRPGGGAPGQTPPTGQGQPQGSNR